MDDVVGSRGKLLLGPRCALASLEFHVPRGQIRAQHLNTLGVKLAWLPSGQHEVKEVLESCHHF